MIDVRIGLESFRGRKDVHHAELCIVGIDILYQMMDRFWKNSLLQNLFPAK